MNPFNLPECLLQGVNLIEASAGTGKTHALAGLFLRLIIEKNLTPRQILVITYTRAATAELKRKIRKMLHDAEHSFHTGRAPDLFLQALLNRYESVATRAKIRRQLSLALADFDEAAIYTIHGFCQRILTENAFASGSLFDIEFIAGQQRLEQEFTEDFWRREFYGNHPVILKYALSCGIDKNYFLRLLYKAVSRPDIKIIPHVSPLPPGNLDESWRALAVKFSEFRSVWRQQRPVITALLTVKALDGKVYGRKVESIAAQIDGFVSASEPPLPLPDSILKLSRSYLQSRTNKGKITPEHAIFDIAQDICVSVREITESLDRYMLGVKKKFLDLLKNEFPELKRRNNILFFDDLLLRAAQALKDPKTASLALVLKEKYPVVLIDEFQDTDPLQFGIIQAIFLPTEVKAPAHTVFYIGDPKQAIYSFRGADIFSYLQAAETVDHKYTMTENWRSEAALVNAVNVLFRSASAPFVFPDIQYVPVEHARELRVPELSVADEDKAAAFQWWFLPAPDGEKSVGVVKAREAITRAVVAEIARLLEAGYKNEAVIGGAPLRESDIAVLVRTNFEAANFQRCLNQKGIKAVLFSMESVFVSREAQELKMLLDGLIHHEDEGYILAALATPLFSLRAGELAACNENEAILELWRSKFKEYFKIWSIKGFLTMFCSLLDREHLRRIIVARSAGERRLTNYLHLAEEIHQAQTEGNLSPAEVLNWLALMRQKEEIVAENEQLRLETDRECVRLVTIHKSKGLEYPVVFCPFAWETAAAEKESVLLCFHDEKNSRQLTGDLGSDYLAPNSEQYRKEMLAENCRLLYVALTRARNRCYFVWGKIKNTGDSPAAYLFHRRQWLSPADWEDINNEEMLANLSLFADQAPADIKIKTIGEVLPAAIAPRKEAADMLPGREFNGSIDRTWKIASFTYFTNLNRPQPEETTWGGKNDEQVDTAALLPVAGVAENMLSFPRGAITGIMLHEILEKIDFTTHDDSAIISNIYDKLAKYNFNLNWQPAILSMIKNLLKIPLGGRGLDKFTLAQLPANSCQKEMEFYFPLRQITAEDIIKILDESGLYEDGSSSVNDLQKQISFPVTQGYLKGFMDLILENDGKYYLADWKSNYLGEGYAQYSAASLRGAMSASSYILQYLIYTVALNRYLQKRMKNYDYEKHFGGVYYIFLRGVNPQEGPDNGIYYDLPAYSLVRRLDRLLLGEDKV